MALKSTNIVFVHGLFGWGPKDLGGLLPYWGEALGQFDPRFTVHEAKCGPVSSFHDRACEVFAQISGTQVDYGAAHSVAAGHAPTTRPNNDCFVPNWSANNPVILVGHSAGAHTCLQLQALLAQDFWGLGTNADWVEVVISVAGVLNGSTLTYKFGCDKQTGRLAGGPSALIKGALGVLKRASPGDWRTGIAVVDRMIDWTLGAALSLFPPPIDLYLDHWSARGRLGQILSRIEQSRFVEGEDNLGFDLSLQGCLKANRNFTSHPNTYYLSLVTSATHEEEPGVWAPDSSINILLDAPLASAARYQATEVDFAQAPIPGWGAGDLDITHWRENDGAVSAISQRYPFTDHAEPVGGEGVFGRGGLLEKGKWYFDRLDPSIGLRFDHFDPAFGAKLKLFNAPMQQAHRDLYQRLNGVLMGL